MLNLFKDRKKYFKKTVFYLDLISVVIFFLLIISQFIFLTYIKFSLSTMVHTLPSILVTLTNNEREEASLSPLLHNETLTSAAQAKADDMAERGYFSHISPEGRNLGFWLDSAGYPYARIGENIAVDFIDSHDVVDAWIKSPLHKAIIMDDVYQEIGVATAQGEYNGKPAIYIVQYLGIQKDQSKVSDINSVTQNSDSVYKQKQVTIQHKLLSAPRTIIIAIISTLLLLVVFKLSVAIHLRHPRLIAVLFTLMVLIVILMYINNSTLFIGDVL